MRRWTKREITKLRERMAEQGRDLHEIASEIRTQTGGSMLRAYRLAAGYSQPQVVDRFLDTAPEAVMDQTLLSRLEGFPGPGARAPRAAQVITFASIFNATPLRLLTPDALDLLPSHERATLIRCGAAIGPPIPLTDSGAPSSGVSPQPRLMPSADLERQVEMAARRALRFSADVEGSNVGPETIAQLQDEVARLAGAYPQRPLSELLGDLAELQDVAFRLLDGRQRPSETTDLYLLAGVLSGMLAKASHDLGSPHAALAQASTAYVCADNIGHDGLRAWTSGLRSLIAYWAGRGNESVRYAQQGAHAAASTRGTASVWLAAQEARGWAILGDAEKARAAIDQAKDARDAVQPDELDQLGGIMTFSLPRQQYYVADAQVWLPDQEHEAARAAEEAIAAYQAASPEERSFSDEAGAHTDLALARANQEDVDAAVTALQPVLELPVEQRIGGIVASVMRVHRTLNTPRLRTAAQTRAVQLEIEAYSRTSAGAALPPGR
ncbi:hypothetical protein [Actinomadura rubrisoli]|uniref:XRE family transcriptional regulator n=1 Tax=Actinomadura rubrisoli TaxID=2530368 RepID=A0A4R5BHF3_9ACTN|nr:hypothetical protein [Actinomadura rubrisoli]TDD84320.1 hypothetical protein E1298_20185 [Actinomadura rubrisoli]